MGRPADGITVRNLVKELSLQIIEHGPTHHKTATTHTWIDLILTDVNDVILDHRNEHLPSFGQHAIIDVTIDFFVPIPTKESFSFRNFKDMCPTSLNDLLSQCNWESMTSIETDLEGALNNLNANLNHTIDQLAPVKTFTTNNKYAPWIGPELRQLINKRNATHRRYKRTGRAALLDEFLRLGNEVDLRITQERDSFLQKHLSDALDDNKDIWKEMRNLGLLPKRKEEDLGDFTPGELNEHFAGMYV